MTTIDPLQLLAKDRAAARERGDAMANLACLATAAAGAAAARMLVLRDLDDGLALFFSATSPKARELASGAAPEVLIYLPSLDVQYRLGVTLRPLAPELLTSHWQRRPEPAKRIDWYYNTVAAQSTVVASREALRHSLAAQPLQAEQPPAGAQGFYLDVGRVDRMRIDNREPPHDRVLYTRTQDGWTASVLVP